jgi:hypothetical protein
MAPSLRQSEHAHERERAAADDAGGESPPRGGGNERDVINMRSALAHVVADSCRSVSTATAAVLIIFFDYEPQRTDAVCSLIVACFVITASVGVCKLWCKLAWQDFSGAVFGRSRRPPARPLAGARPSLELPTATCASYAATAHNGSEPSVVWHESGLSHEAALHKAGVRAQHV